MLRRFLFFLPALSAMALITVASSLPGDPEHGLLIIRFSLNLGATLQNFLHIPAFAVLGYLWLWAFDKALPHFRWSHYFTLIAGILFAIADEFHQSFVPHRYGNIMDVLFDTIGLALACATWPLLRTRLFSPHPTTETSAREIG